MDEIMKACKSEIRPFKIGNWLMKLTTVSELAFADDLVLIAKSEEDLQYNLNVWNREFIKKNIFKRHSVSANTYMDRTL